MKLRVKGNALRLRLTQGEMRALAERGQVEELTEFPGGATLVYRLCSSDKIDSVSASYEKDLIEFRIPAALAQRWCSTDLVTVSGAARIPSGELQVVLEKDYACLVPRPGEDESDNFPHPEAGQNTC